MSYARFGRDSDVYVYPDVGGYISCCGCSLSRDWAHYSVESVVNHMREHVDAGHTVPDDLLDPDTFSDARFTPMCTAYMCRKDEGHDGPHTGRGAQQ